MHAKWMGPERRMANADGTHLYPMKLASKDC